MTGATGTLRTTLKRPLIGIRLRPLLAIQVHAPFDRCQNRCSLKTITLSSLTFCCDNWKTVISAPDCQRVWTNLRNRMGREIKNASSETEASSSTKWEYYDALSFLQKHIKARKTFLSIQTSDPLDPWKFIHEESLQSNQSSESAMEDEDRHSKKIKTENNCSSIDNSISVSDLINTSCKVEKSADEALGEYIVARLKEMDSVTRRMKRKRLLEVLEDEDLM
ncbi:uncharacterized protein LOC109600936 isoform X1 [Aethina tumida]|uniref:uncharacterized protein LOC109600936 isoform X1 n=1 Tax=Aethina tumida TaxID=116153 RepID=UPI00096B0794|nr:uncharacterized protein LOC109600936 isoform X1 [Aethina tumida]XP_019872688.1 uncharacterized protein LOC109600936 isoform X1 [Aethina tumida]